jgi:beta-glucuronidase
MYHRVFDRIDAVVGEQVWTFADFATRSGICGVDGNKKGVFTRERRPKASVHALRRRWRGEASRTPDWPRGEPAKPRPPGCTQQ